MKSDLIRQLKEEINKADEKIEKLQHDSKCFQASLEALTGKTTTAVKQASVHGGRKRRSHVLGDKRAAQRDFKRYLLEKYIGKSNLECVIDALVNSAPSALTTIEIATLVYGPEAIYSPELWLGLTGGVAATLSSAVTNPPRWMNLYNLQSATTDGEFAGPRARKIWACDPIDGHCHEPIALVERKALPL